MFTFYYCVYFPDVIEISKNVILSTFVFWHRTSSIPVDDTLLPSQNLPASISRKRYEIQPKNLPANVRCYFCQMDALLDLLRETSRQNHLEANARTAATYNTRLGIVNCRFLE